MTLANLLLVVSQWASPLVACCDALLHQLAASRHDHVPANHASTWLFPVRGDHTPLSNHHRASAADLRFRHGRHHTDCVSDVTIRR